MDLRRVRQSGALGLFVGAFLLGYAVLTGLRPELPFAHHESTLLLLGDGRAGLRPSGTAQRA
jgi:hypothetical protein